jgi:hypothetical protein
MLTIRGSVVVVKERQAEGETDADYHTEKHTHGTLPADYVIASAVCGARSATAKAQERLVLIAR